MKKNKETSFTNKDKSPEHNMMTALGGPGGIERSEKVGQSRLVNSSQLPVEFNYGNKEDLEKLGVKFGEKVNDLFYAVEFPKGWKKKATDHSMWSELYNDKREMVANIFYKAAFYDERAHIDVEKKFHTR